MIELKLIPSTFVELLKKGYSLDMMFILKMMEEGMEIEDIPKTQSLISTIERKALAKDGKLSLEGKSLLDFLSTKGDKKIIKKKVLEEPFLLWWTAYPSTDSFDYKGRHFQGTRSLKAKKDDCKLKLNKILNEGQYTIEELIKAIELEVHQKKENSIKTGENKLKYQQNSHTYLLQYTYESFVELIRKGIKVKEELVNTGGTDI